MIPGFTTKDRWRSILDPEIHNTKDRWRSMLDPEIHNTKDRWRSMLDPQIHNIKKTPNSANEIEERTPYIWHDI